MKRIVFPTLAVTALMTLSACKGGGAKADAVKLIPDGAQMMAGINPKALMSSPLYTENKDTLLKDDEAKDTLAAMKDCNIDPEKLENIIVGIHEEEHFAAVVTGPGVGNADNLQCIADKVKEKEGEAPFTIEDKDGKKTLNIDDGDATAFLINDNTLAIADKEWTDKLAERVDGKGTPAIEGSLKDIYGKADSGKHVWFVGIVPEDMKEDAGALGAAPTSLHGSVDLSDGLAVSMSAVFGSADDAKTVAEQGQTQFDGMKAMAGMFGVPQPVVDSVKIEAKDTEVAVSAKATKDDLDKMSEQLKKMGG